MKVQLSTKKAKLRVAATCPGYHQELLAIRDRGESEGVAIILPVSEHLANEWHGKTARPTEMRLSVHPTRDGKHFIFTHNVASEDGVSTATRATVERREGNMLWLLFSYTVTVPAHDTKTLDARKNDIVLELGDYDPRLNTLVFFVFISTKSDINGLMPDYFNSEVLDFGHLTVALLWAFMPSPSLRHGWFHMDTNGSVKINGELNEWAEGHRLASIPFNEKAASLVMFKIAQHFQHHADLHIRRGLENFAETQERSGRPLSLMEFIKRSRMMGKSAL